MLCIPRQLYARWGEQSTYIAQLELLVVLAAMLHFAPIVRESRGLWLVDSTAPLMALISGNSNNMAFDEMAQLVVQIVMFDLDRPYTLSKSSRGRTGQMR